MTAVNFPDWSSVLKDDATLSERERASFKITIRWFLGFCKRSGRGADFEQAKAFIDFVRRDKQANDWLVERWKEAIRWFFRAAKAKVSGEAPLAAVESAKCEVGSAKRRERRRKTCSHGLWFRCR